MSPLNIVVNRKFWPSSKAAHNDLSRKIGNDITNKALIDFDNDNLAQFKTSPDFLKEGAFFIGADQVIYKHSLHGDTVIMAPKGTIVSEQEKIADTSEKREKYLRLSLLIQMRDTVHTILNAQENTADEDIDEPDSPPWLPAQQRLQKLYETFTHSFGPINKYEWLKSGVIENDGSRNVYKVKTNLIKFRRDPDAYLVAAIEDFDEDTQSAKPGAIFKQRILRARSPVKTLTTTKEALRVCLDEKGRLNIPFIEKLLPQKSQQDIIGELNEQNLAYFDPVQCAWILSEEYLSGDIGEKIKAINDYIANHPDENKNDYSKNLKALENSLPATIQAEEIELSLGMPWIPGDIISKFAVEELGLQEVEIEYTGISHRWFVTSKIVDDFAAHYEYGTDIVDSGRLLEFALNNKEPSFRVKTDSTGAPLERELEKKLAATRMDKIKDRFKEWALENPQISDRLQTEYNQIMNSTAPRKFDASHLTFAGSNLSIDLQGHQRKGVARDLHSPSTLLEWDVGAGKTFGAIAACMEGKKHGNFNKAMFVVQNHLLGEFARDFMALYPRANILVVEEDQFMDEGDQTDIASKLNKFVDKAKEHDWDAIIITKSNFDRFEVSTSRKIKTIIDKIERITAEKLGKTPYSAIYRHLNDKIEKLKLNIADLLVYNNEEMQDQDSTILKSQKLRLVNELLEEPFGNEVWQAYISEKGEAPSFEELGIDKLYVDEAHDYKNLDIKSRIADVSRSGSAKAISFKEKLDYLREINPDNYAVLMTATPILNALMEFYVFQSYMQPELLEKKGLAHPDAWLSMFGEMVEDTELAPETGYYRMVSRLSSYKNIPELMQMYNSFSDMVTRAELHQKNMPELVDENGKVTGSPQIVHVPESPQLNEYFQNLTLRAIRVREGQVSTSADNILKIINEARQATLDPRLVGLKRNPDIPTKIDNCAQKIATRYYQNLNKVYFADEEKSIPDPLTGSLQMVLCNQGIPKGDGSFSVYEELGKSLIEEGIPADKIAFVHDHTSDKKKEELFRRCRNGEISVLIGTTQKLGTGTNVQKRLIALHELDAAWRPGDVIQGRGRIDRPKNQNPHIEILTYIQEGSFDIYNWQMLERKARFMAQAKKGAKIRKFSNLDEFTAFCEDAKNSASNDPLLLEKGQTAQEIAHLRFSKNAFNNEKRRARKRIPALKTEITASQKQLELLREHKKSVNFNALDPIYIGTDIYNNEIEAGIALKKIIRDLRQELKAATKLQGKDISITRKGGIIRGVKASLRAEIDQELRSKFTIVIDDAPLIEISISQDDIQESRFEREFNKITQNQIRNKFNGSTLSLRSLFKDKASFRAARDDYENGFKKLAERIIKPLSQIDENIQNLEGKLAALTSEQKRMERIVSREFDQEDRYKYLMRRRRLIDKKLVDRQNSINKLSINTALNNLQPQAYL